MQQSVNSQTTPKESEPDKEPGLLPEASQVDQKDLPGAHRIDQNGLRYVGKHLMIDLWEAKGLDDEELIARALRDAVTACGATLLELTIHRFKPQGLTAVAILSESHLSIHCWPEKGYAAVDVFTCGDAEPARAVPVLREAFLPGSLQVVEQKRGARAD
ncbi:MAG TPA: adenosylmethionine decarboxylase [Pseudonocardiaceae bacterium]|nr:adenosylmethionine decarboxylase [Pseudonocardiaceae bacterium]